MAAGERAATAGGTRLSRLQESLSANETILRDEHEDVARRRRACSELLQCLEASLLQDSAEADGDELRHRPALLDMYRQVGLTVLAHGDLLSESQLLYTLLRVLQQTAKRPPLHRTLLLEWLPRAMLMSDADERLAGQVLRVLKETIKSDPASTDTVLQTFTRLPLSEEGRDQVVDMLLPTLESTTTICEPGAERLIRTLLFFVNGFTDEQADMFWLALRRGAMPMPATASTGDGNDTSAYHDCLTSIVHMLLANFHHDESGPWLAHSYRKHIEDQNATNSRFCTVLDVLLVILLGEELQSAHAEAVDQILGQWLNDDCLPMEELDHHLQLLVSSETSEAAVSVRARLMQPLLQLTLFLVLAPLRCEITAQGTYEKDMRSLIVTIYELLDQGRQLEFVLSLLNVCSPELMADSAAKEKSVATIQMNVIALLEAVTGAATHDHLSAIKSLLIERLLTVTTPLSTAVVSCDHQMCVMLASLLCLVDRQNPSEPEYNQEVMTITQNLLLSPSLKSTGGGVTVNNPLVVRGIILATELVRISVTAAKVAGLRELVLKHLLPTTRFTVDPATGLAGLDFLQAWADKYPASKATVFQDIKMILANTGLVQRQHEDQNKLQQVAYARVPEYINGLSTKLVQIKPMLLCVSYFMRRVTLEAPARWKNTIQWIFNLLDMYLTFGQESAPKTWQFEGWLMAGIQFPANPLPIGLYESADYVVRFDNDSLFSDITDVDYAMIIDKWQKGTNGAVSLEPILEYQLSLWIAISVSAALLKNAFHHFKSQSKSDGRSDSGILRLIQLQLLKLYDMKWRLQFSASLIRELRNRESQVSASRSKTKNGRRSRMSVSQSEEGSISDVNISAEALTYLEMWFFNDDGFISSTILWACLLGPTDEQLIISAFSEDNLYKASPDGLFMTLKVHLLDHLVSRKDIQHDLAAITDRLMHCSRICDFLINRLPSLRLSSCTNDTSTYALAVSLTISYLRVLLKLYDIRILVNVSESIDDPHDRKEEIMVAIGWLKITDNEDIASCIIDILTALATCETNTDAIEKAIEMSWTALHTIYANSGYRPVGKQEALTIACLCRKQYKWSDSYGKKLHRQLRESWLAQTSEKESYMASHRRILQHFGLLLYESKLFVRNFDHITYLVADIHKCAAQLRAQCGYEEDHKESQATTTQPSSPNLPFLANATCSGIHKVTLNVVIWALAAVDPVTTQNESPFECYTWLTGLFMQLIDIFCKSYHAFPNTSRTFVIQAAHRALLAGVSSSHRCIEWRHQLMNLSEPAYRNGMGSLSHLKALFDAIAADIIGRIFNLCDFFLAVEDCRLVTRVNKLRQAANESLSSLNMLASMHNFPSLKYTSSATNKNMTDDGTKTRRTTGFHETKNLQDDKAPTVPDSIESSSEGSFGVAGDWDCSDSEQTHIE